MFDSAMMRIEFRDDFKGDDVLILMGAVQDVRALSAGLLAWSIFPSEVLLSSILPACDGVEITLQRHGSPHARMASDSLPGVLWRIGKDAARQLADLIGQLSRHPRPAHLYLDFEGYTRTIIISMDEY
ncbi:hypothetical protein NG824_14835 [Xanthomonas sacchari]|uniref:Uncharacterized protein n=2 Tax=Xanthomonas sacchari TaxID=56458 RepID=A0AA46SPR6_9XANT|nr:hypothetical protein [Xanthomonas sacchari]UYK87752.1 hypothetical protein NG824_14835 [Xanthomonas sacchari]